jgi:hypothetical protein
MKKPSDTSTSTAFLTEVGKKKGVRFNEIDGNDPSYSIPAGLTSLYERFNNGNYQVLPAEEQLLKTRYIHVSANWNSPLKEQTPSGLNQRAECWRGSPVPTSCP